MKYDVLEPFRKQLEDSCTSPNTSRKYYAAVVKLLDDLQFDNVEEIPLAYIQDKLQSIKGKNEFSAVKNGLKHLKEVYPTFLLPNEESFKELSLQKKNRSKKPKKNIYLDTTMRKINQIKNKKIKYAYRLAVISGLRVSELAAVQKKDLKFEDGLISIYVRNGKGGANGTITCMKDDYLYENLQQFVIASKEDNLFFSESCMRKNAHSIGLECHDFRRIFAINYRNSLKKNMPIQLANVKTKDALRHIRFSTTKRYLFNRKLVIKATRGESWHEQ